LRYKLATTVLFIALIAVSLHAFKPVMIAEVEGTSMEPTFPDGIYVIAVKKELYLLWDPNLRGDVVIFEAVKMTTPYTAVGYYVCHRVTYYDGKLFNAKGDANLQEDFPEPVPAEAIKYVVVAGLKWR